MTLEEHSRDDEMRFEKMGSILENIRDNHLAHLQSDSSAMKADIAWLRWFICAIILLILGLYIK